MPYYRRRYYNRNSNYRKYRRQARKYRRIRGYGRMAYSALKGVMRLKSLVNTEFKALDTENNFSASTSPAVILLNGMQRGDDISEREGRSIRVKSFQWFFKFQIHASATDTLVRWAIFLDKQANGSSSNVANSLYTDVESGMRDLDNRRRFLILKAGVVVLNQDFPEKSRRGYKRCDFKTIYDAGNAGNIGDIHTNALYLWHSSDESTNTPTVNSIVRIRFVDN